jgi:hypothetical protein
LVNKAFCLVIAQVLSYCSVVGGIPKGTGAGKNKQQAKEEAARQALEALGWGSGASGPYRCAFSHLFGQSRVGADNDIRMQYGLF